MTDSERSIESFFEEMLRKGLISTSSFWIEKAIQEKNTRLAASIAHSQLLVYDKLDIMLIRLVTPN